MTISMMTTMMIAVWLSLWEFWDSSCAYLTKWWGRTQPCLAHRSEGLKNLSKECKSSNPLNQSWEHDSLRQLTRHQKNKSPFLFHISLYTHVRLQTSPRFNLHALWLVKKATFLILVSPYWFHEINFWPMIYKIFLNTPHIMHGLSSW